MGKKAIKPQWQNFISIVKKEVVPALGCTEPISLALAAATAAHELSGPIDRIEAKVSSNLMKNGMGVTVPGTGTTGLMIAAAVGALGGDPEGALEVLHHLTPEQTAEGKRMIQENRVTLAIAEVPNILYSEAKIYSGTDWALAAIADLHTNVIRIEKNGQLLYQATPKNNKIPPEQREEDLLTHCCLQDIFTFAVEAPIEHIDFIHDAANLNLSLSHAGIAGNFGLHIGATMQRQIAQGMLPDSLFTQIILRTTAASDARMGGASLPAMTNSGSGNQGITATMPVVVTAEYLKTDRETMIRALMLSHLTAIYIHSRLPKLSAFCAVTTAAMGSAAGMAWLFKKDFHAVSMAISNMIGDVSGMICDGASNSCAMKVSTSVTSAYKAVLLALENTQVSSSDGIVETNIDASIANLGKLASNGMQETDREILAIMMEKNCH